MGLLQAGSGALGSALGDQWREYFYCESMNEDVLAAKGVKRTSRRSSNVRGSDNIISNGSVIAVNEGQCMMIVDQGAIVEFSALPGEFVWDSSAEPSIFYGSLGRNIGGVWETLKRRFTFGGDTGRDQRVYYFNIKEIIGNKYGTANPVPFRVVDRNVNLDIDVSVKCFGEYSYRVTNPMLFYKNVCGNVSGDYGRDRIDGQMRAELMTALQPAFARISEMGIRYSALPGHTSELADALNTELSNKWRDLRGVEIVSVGVSSIKASEEDEAMIKELQRNAALRDPSMAAAHLVGAQAEAMKAAASNEHAGAFMGFAGLNMANAAGGMNAQSLFQMGQQPQQGAQRPAPAQGGWKCACGKEGNTGNFCSECGSPRPAQGWTCRCGCVNKGRFCTSCGAKKPAGALLYKCDKCGWEPEDPARPPKFCPRCGDPFGDEDIR